MRVAKYYRTAIYLTSVGAVEVAVFVAQGGHL